MPAAARILESTIPGGQVLGPGVSTVLIGGQPAAIMTDNHLCSIPANSPHPQSSTFVTGSSSVMIGGKPALRVNDSCACEAKVAVGEPTVIIGG